MKLEHLALAGHQETSTVPRNRDFLQCS